MLTVVALGGNALLQRGEPLTADNQRLNVQRAAAALASLTTQRQLVITHGNGPQVGMLALQSMTGAADDAYPLDILDAETEGMIGYLIEQELQNRLPEERRCVTLLTQIEVDPDDRAFCHPSKPIGPVYERGDALRLARDRGWTVALDGTRYRRVVPSPRPIRILELTVIELLVSQQILVICAGGGGIPVVRRRNGSLIGVEAVIDKDAASALLARQLGARALLMLTDVDALYDNWGLSDARAIRRIAPQELRTRYFAEGSMAPKVRAACDFVEQTGGIAGIGRLQDAEAILDGEAGTLIELTRSGTLWWS
ncbi:carbamate kinase [Marinobacterium sp. D7]|uniref:carbamate kinase n=1 Tax=Marinobacterium ramblicola TaxID=2849041 RepID=UPI001C2DCEED|nr:carbamate kinase [Marinobacterium ramblicola]MBV1788139.1 carbamate kinase [Marinobacterium ramblicola]